MKIERILQSQGFGTRRECRAIVRAGLFRVDQNVIDDPFAELDPVGLEFVVDGIVWQFHEKAYLLLHKPAGFECSHKPQHHRSVFALLPPELVRRDVQCVGRLDHDTTGLLLLSDEGQFIHIWSSGKKRIPKTYEVTTCDPLTDDIVDSLLAGVKLHDELAPVRAIHCQRSGEYTLTMTVTEGKYHQVKRMIGALGHRVAALHRAMVGGLSLPADLAPGDWRWLSSAELARLSDFRSEPISE